MASNYKNIEGILKMSGFVGVKVYPNPVMAMATDEQGQHFDFWQRDGRLWLEIDHDPNSPDYMTAKLSVDLANYADVDQAFQGLIDFYLESERELEEEGY